jgi:hypothetical protein
VLLGLFGNSEWSSKHDPILLTGLLIASDMACGVQLFQALVHGFEAHMHSLGEDALTGHGGVPPLTGLHALELGVKDDGVCAKPFVIEHALPQLGKKRPLGHEG